jgi:hypothetical protein
VVAELEKILGRPLRQHTYKNRCGEFPAASALGFAVAVELAQHGKQTALLYTLSRQDGKAVCLIEP